MGAWAAAAPRFILAAPHLYGRFLWRSHRLMILRPEVTCPHRSVPQRWGRMALVVRSTDPSIRHRPTGRSTGAVTHMCVPGRCWNGTCVCMADGHSSSGKLRCGLAYGVSRSDQSFMPRAAAAESVDVAVLSLTPRADHVATVTLHKALLFPSCFNLT